MTLAILVNTCPQFAYWGYYPTLVGKDITETNDCCLETNYLVKDVSDWVDHFSRKDLEWFLFDRAPNLLALRL